MRLFTWQRRGLLLLAVAFSMLCLAGCGVGEENPAGGGGGGGGNNVIGNNNCTSAATCKQVTIGTQVWMAENLNIATSSGSWCYDNKPDSCNKYGRLYDWETAATVCPLGWHLPDTVDWNRLTDHTGDSSVAGLKLKSTSGWGDADGGKSGNGTDDYGFSALPGGILAYSGVSFLNDGCIGSWWTATESSIPNIVYITLLTCGANRMGDWGAQGKSNGSSVRCLRD